MNILDVEVDITQATETIAESRKPKIIFIPDKSKPVTQWRDELIAEGLVCDGRKFSIKGQSAPVAIRLADKNLESKFGTNPRLSFDSGSATNHIVGEILDKYGLKIKEHRGYTVEGFDFPDVKSAKDLAKALMVIVQEYHKA